MKKCEDTKVTKEENNEEKFTPEEQISESQHSVEINGKKIEYKAVAGTILIDNKRNDVQSKAKASVFYVAYTKNGVEKLGERPITFAFNGGPGSSSVWLHMGALGPRRVKIMADGKPYAAPYELIPNEYSILAETDLVFIDPISTGFSRAVEESDAQDYHGFTGDIESVGDFIRLYTTRNKRWSSPKFLAGESYGTTRAAGLSWYLQENLGMYISGIMFISSILDFGTARFIAGNDLPFILFLPTYTATAWYHKKLDAELQKDLQKTLTEVEKFATNEYTLALMKGNKITADERADIISKLSRYTGLSEKYIDHSNLRINIHRFVKELMRDERLTVGRLDSRFLGRDKDSAGEGHEYDPSYAAIKGVYTAVMNDYLSNDLNFESDLCYQILTANVHPWKYTEHQNQYINVAETLRKAVNLNPHLRIYVANGYYDLATPYFATQYTFEHFDLEPNSPVEIEMGYYKSGHMMYAHEPSLKQLQLELQSFVKTTVNKKS